MVMLNKIALKCETKLAIIVTLEKRKRESVVITCPWKPSAR